MQHSTNNKRNSSVELFRILATFMVMTVHFNGWFVDMGPFEEFSCHSIIQGLIESFTCICVNSFLIITGWYGLQIKWRHFWTIYSIIVWIYVPFYMISSIYEGDFNFKTLIIQFIGIGSESYYIQSYLMLMFLSPILNSFINKYGKSILPYTIIFWFIEFFLDCVLNNKCLGFGGGYQLTHFVFMYLFGRTASLYKDDLFKLFNVLNIILITIGGTLTIFGLYIVGIRWAFLYTNPINIIMTLALFVGFEKNAFYSDFINWISKSTLSVYIFHITYPVITVLIKIDKWALLNCSLPLYYIAIFTLIFCVFCIATLYDKVRILTFDKLGNPICNWLTKHTLKYMLGK